MNKKNAITLLLAATQATLCGSAIGQNQDELLSDSALTIGEVVVDGDQGPLATRSLLSSVDILGDEKIESQNVTHSWELLGQMPGIMLTDFNQGTTSGKFSMRAFNGEGEINAVKLLLDGVPGNSNDGNMPYLDMAFPLDIETIEVVRGTNDPRYGLHNIAGNVDVRTRTGGNYLLGRAGYGSFDTRTLQASAGIEQDGFSQNYAVGYQNSDGYRDHSAAEQASFAGKWFFSPNQGQTRFGLIARHYDTTAQEPGYLTFAQSRSDPTMSPAHNASDGGKRGLNQISGHLDTAVNDRLFWSTRLYLNQLDDRRFVRFSEAVSQQERYTDEEHVGGSTSLTWRPEVGGLNDLVIIGGVDAELQDNRSERYSTTDRVRQSQTRDQQFDFDIYGAFVQAIVKPTERLKLVPAFRVDQVDGSYTNRLNGQTYDINDYGLIQQPKFSAVYSLTDSYALYGNWGRTFQVGVGTAAYKVNQTSDLDPSINEGWELGLKFRPAAWLDGRVAVWRQTASNETRRKLNDPANDAENIGKTRREGIDIQLNARPVERLSVWFATALQRSEILRPESSSPASQGREIDHVPRYLIDLGADYDATDSLRLSISAASQGDYFLERTNTTGKFGGYTLFNASALYRVNPKLRVELQVKNLTDRYYEYVWYDGSQSLHSPGNGRALYATAHLSL